MRPINIQITKAKIRSFTVELRENNEPIVSITIDLFDSGGSQITTYSISNYYGNKFELPPTLTAPIVKLLDEFEIITAEHCNNRQKLTE